MKSKDPGPGKIVADFLPRVLDFRLTSADDTDMAVPRTTEGAELSALSSAPGEAQFRAYSLLGDTPILACGRSFVKSDERGTA